MLAPVLLPPATRISAARLHALLAVMRRALQRLRDGLRVFRRPRQAAIATAVQLLAWALQWLSCWLLLIALGLDVHAGAAAAAGVLFAVNVTALVPATPANIGVFQAACVAVLAGAYHVSTPDAIAYGIVLQAVELATGADYGRAGAAQRGPVLARGAPAHDARRARAAQTVARAGVATRVSGSDRPRYVTRLGHRVTDLAHQCKMIGRASRMSRSASSRESATATQPGTSGEYAPHSPCSPRS